MTAVSGGGDEKIQRMRVKIVVKMRIHIADRVATPVVM